MSLHADLLKQAHHLATKEPRRPSQASLRRAISASYYALFHRLVDDASRMMISRRDRDPLRQCLSRAFRYSDMRDLCRSLAGGTPPAKLEPAFNNQTIDRRLVRYRAVIPGPSGSATPSRLQHLSSLPAVRSPALSPARYPSASRLERHPANFPSRRLPDRPSDHTSHSGLIPLPATTIARALAAAIHHKEKPATRPAPLVRHRVHFPMRLPALPRSESRKAPPDRIVPSGPTSPLETSRSPLPCHRSTSAPPPSATARSFP